MQPNHFLPICRIAICQAAILPPAKYELPSRQVTNCQTAWNRIACCHAWRLPTVNCQTAYTAPRYRFQGPNSAPSTACASGVHAIGESFRMIQVCTCEKVRGEVVRM